jgi:hypothetical protein
MRRASFIQAPLSDQFLEVSSEGWSYLVTFLGILVRVSFAVAVVVAAVFYRVNTIVEQVTVPTPLSEEQCIPLGTPPAFRFTNRTLLSGNPFVVLNIEIVGRVRSQDLSYESCKEWLDSFLRRPLPEGVLGPTGNALVFLPTIAAAFFPARCQRDSLR